MAEISLKIKSDFEKAAADFKKIDMSSESFQKSLAKLQTQMANGSIDKFMQKNQLAATAMTAAKGATAGLEKELAGLQSEIKRLIKSGLDPMNPALDKMKGRMSEIQGQLPQTTSRFGALGNAVTALGVGFGAYQIANKIYDIGKASLTAAANMEQQTVAFTTMLGSAEKAKTLLSDMQQFAANTPFSFNEVVDAGKRLVAFGVNASDVTSTLRKLGDVSAGLSQPIGDIVYLYGTIKTAGRAMSVDLAQFANRGIPIYEELAKVLKINVSQVKDFASQGKIGFNEIEQVFTNLTAEGGKFAGLMGAQAQTLSGKWSNFGDNLDRIAVTLGNKMMPAANGVLDLLNLMLESDTSEYQRKMQSMIDMQEKYIKLDAQGSKEAGYYRGQLYEMEKTLFSENGRTFGLQIKANATAKERLDTYRQIKEMSMEEAKIMGLISGGEKIRSDLAASDLDIYKKKGELTKDQIKQLKEESRLAARAGAGAGVGSGVAKTEDQIFQDRLNKMAMSENAAYQQRLNMASSFYEQRLALEGAKTEEEVQLWSQAQVRDIENSKMTAAQKIIAIEAVNKAVKKSAENQMANYAAFGNHMLSNTGSMLTDLQTVFKNAGKESRTLAYMLKGVSAAEAAINSYVAFTRALAAFPPPFNYVAAGITLAAGLAKQAAILSTPISAETGLSNYTVPDVRGNRNDGAPVMAQGGEKVTVTPRGEDMTQATSINISIDEAVLFSVVQRGIKTGQINLNNKNVGRGVFAN